MKKVVPILLITFFVQTCVFAQVLNTGSLIKSYTKDEINALIAASVPLFPPTVENGVKAYKLNYNTLDPFGGAIVASGAVLVPDLPGCNDFPLVSNQHGTILKKDRVPSNLYADNLDGLLFAGNGYVVSLPDYIGLGDSPGMHYYMHSESEARASADMMRASREWMDSLGVQLNGQVFLTGYSQGGHSTMALHKYIEEESLTSEFDIIASAPLSGAFDLNGQIDRMLSDSTYPAPGFIPYLIESYNQVYQNLYSNLSAYFKPPYDSLIPIYMDGTYTLNQLNQQLTDNIYNLMQDSVLQNVINDQNFSHPLRAALKTNENYNWKPEAPVRMFYCDADELVFHESSLTADSVMNALNANDVEAINAFSGFDHTFCFLPANTQTLDYFDQLSTKCILTSVNEINQTLQVNVYPVPASESITIDFDGMVTNATITLSDVSGQLMVREECSNSDRHHMELPHVTAGVYLLRINMSNQIVNRRIVIH
mgnify:CR=1 FL=1